VEEHVLVAAIFSFNETETFVRQSFDRAFCHFLSPFLKSVSAALPDTTGSGCLTAEIQSNGERGQNKLSDENWGHHRRALIVVVGQTMSFNALNEHRKSCRLCRRRERPAQSLMAGTPGIAGANRAGDARCISCLVFFKPSVASFVGEGCVPRLISRWIH
jgi:hypothetical protein